MSDEDDQLVNEEDDLADEGTDYEEDDPDPEFIDDERDPSEFENLVEETRTCFSNTEDSLCTVENCLDASSDLLPGEANAAFQQKVEQAKFRLEEITASLTLLNTYVETNILNRLLEKVPE